MAKVLFDNAHGENLMLEDHSPGSFSKLIKEIQSHGHKVGDISDEKDFTFGNLNGAEILVIAFPSKKFSSHDVEAILHYVEKGGGLLLTGEWGNLHGNADILNTVSQSYKVVFNKDRITDQRDVHEEEVKMMGHTAGRRKVPTYARIRKFALHPITHEIKEVGHVSGCSLNAPKYTVLAWSDDQSFADMDGDGELDPDEPVGSFATAVSPDLKKGRVVCIGDTSILTNHYFEQMDNRKFLLNILHWLSKKL